jgi:hypothetical protein
MLACAFRSKRDPDHGLRRIQSKRTNMAGQAKNKEIASQTKIFCPRKMKLDVNHDETHS